MKDAILSAVVLLRDEVDQRSSRWVGPPTYVKIQRSIKKITRKINLAMSIRRTTGRIRPAQEEIIKELRRRRTSLAIYIGV